MKMYKSIYTTQLACNENRMQHSILSHIVAATEQHQPIEQIASPKFLGNLANAAIFVLIVSGLANPDSSVEMEATAFIPEQNS